MVHLLDVNLLIALTWPNHAHHAAAHTWFAAHQVEGWATCPLTQCGFVRVSMNPKIRPAAVSTREVIDALRELLAHPNHVFWLDDVPFSDGTLVPHDMVIGHQQVTDAYLIGLAVRYGGRLATFDRALPTLLPVSQQDVVVVVPA